MIGVIAMGGERLIPLAAPVRTWLELVLTAPVVLWAAAPFFVRWWQSILNKSPNMWTLIGTGVGAAFGYSVAATLVPHWFPASFQEHGRVGVYFEAAAIIVSLTLLGQILELKARSSTSQALRALLERSPTFQRFCTDYLAALVDQSHRVLRAQLGDRCRQRLHAELGEIHAVVDHLRAPPRQAAAAHPLRALRIAAVHRAVEERQQSPIEPGAPRHSA